MAHSHGAGVPDQSRAERRTSYDPADFPVPSGREEDWRFTPLDRLRGLHDDAVASSAPVVTATLPDDGSITLERVASDDARLGATGTPEDRAAALAWRVRARRTSSPSPPRRRTSRPHRSRRWPSRSRAGRRSVTCS